MFLRLKRRINDMQTIRQLCLGAEAHANADGQKEPGLEHFALASLDLSDGTARRAFERLGVDPDSLRAAITQQHADALAGIGIDPCSLREINGPAVTSDVGIYKAKPQAQALMQQLAGREKRSGAEPLMAAHVIAAIASFQQGTAARAFRVLRVHPQALIDAAHAEIDAVAAHQA